MNLLIVVSAPGDKSGQVSGDTTDKVFGLPFKQGFELHKIHHRFDILDLNDIPRSLDKRNYHFPIHARNEPGYYPPAIYQNLVPFVTFNEDDETFVAANQTVALGIRLLYNITGLVANKKDSSPRLCITSDKRLREAYLQDFESTTRFLNDNFDCFILPPTQFYSSQVALQYEGVGNQTLNRTFVHSTSDIFASHHRTQFKSPTIPPIQ